MELKLTEENARMKSVTRPSTETGDDGLNGTPVTNHVVTANERGRDPAMTQRQNTTGKTVWELTHSIECVI